MKSSENRFIWLPPALVATATILFYQFFYPYHLFFKEQIQLFIYTPDFFYAYFDKPGWLSALSGDFLTQFFYLRGGGPIVLAALFTIEWLTVKTVLKQSLKLKNAALWAIIPVAADFTAHLSWQHTASWSMGFIYLLLLDLLINRIKNKTLVIVGLTLIGVFGQWVLGNPVLLLPFLLLFKRDLYRPILTSITLLTILLMVPYFSRPNYLLTIVQLYLFPALSWKVMLVPGSFVVMLTAAKIHEKLNHTVSTKWLVVLFTVLVLFAGIRLNANFGLEKILALDTETYFGNNEKVLELAEKERLENRVASYYTNMALAQKGQLPDRMFEFYQPSIHGLILPVSQYENWQNIFFSNELFYLLGDMNLAQHSAMLGNTFSPYNRSSRMMRRLAEINMVIGDREGAEKFLRILSKTLFHKKWAQNRLSENRDGAQIQWLEVKRKQIAKSDKIRTAFNYIGAIEFLTEQNPQNRLALDYLLCYHLLNKDLLSFKTAYDRFAFHQLNTVPKAYAEALLISLFREKATEETIAAYKIDPAQVREFLNYTTSFEAAKGELAPLKQKYGETYWVYYHFATITGDEE